MNGWPRSAVWASLVARLGTIALRASTIRGNCKLAAELFPEGFWLAGVLVVVCWSMAEKEEFVRLARRSALVLVPTFALTLWRISCSASLPAAFSPHCWLGSAVRRRRKTLSWTPCRTRVAADLSAGRQRFSRCPLR